MPLPAPRGCAALLDLVLPTPCAGCGDPGARLCASCAAVFAAPGWAAVAGLPPTLVLARYAGAARAVVLAYKERGRRDLAVPLAARLRAALRGAGLVGPGTAGCRLVPAPSRPAAARARGGDHVRVLARAVARPDDRPDVPVRVTPALALGRRARDSVGLDPAARAANLAAHLRLCPAGVRALHRGPPAPVVLLDDVLTTGATARAGVAALRSAGVAVAAVVVLTATGGAHR